MARSPRVGSLWSVSHRLARRLRDTMAPRERSRARRRLLAPTAAGTAVLLAAACTANTGGGTGNSGGGPGATGGNQPSSAKYLSYSPCCSWNATWSFNPYNVNGLLIQNDYITMRLAIQRYPSLTDYVPQLADSWTTKGNQLTVHLRPGVKWQDGSPVTSKDVYATAILDGTRGDAFWNDITDVAAPTADTVTFTLLKGEPVALAENDILANILPYPASIYGKFATEGLKKDLTPTTTPSARTRTGRPRRRSPSGSAIASSSSPRSRCPS